MKVVIFAGGYGTRISEESHLKPKPMIEIGGKPILWHILKIYESQGFNDFIICLGYKGYMIKEYFLNYYYHNADISLDLSDNSSKILHSTTENFKVTLIETGLNTKTAGRLKQIQKYTGNETFMLTYGDGLSNININELILFHKNHGKIATVTTILPEGKFGSIITDKSNNVIQFMEKPRGDGNWINGGFFILEPNVFNYLGEDSNNIMWEDFPLHKLTQTNQLVAYKHTGFWKCMDALRDKIELDQLWETGNPPWKTW